MNNWGSILDGVSVIPVLVVNRVDDAIPLAKTLAKAGMNVLEVTLRTPAALDVIEAMSTVPGVVVGAGTVLSPDQYDQVCKRGAGFVVSPGHTVELLDAADQNSIPYLPGAQTLSEMMSLRQRGYNVMKCFPADMNGGPKFLKTVSSVLDDVKFCPTGGVSEANANEYLSLPNVACVGGSWIAPRGLVDEQNWSEIHKRAYAATQI